MIQLNSLVIYKNKPAIVKDKTDEKYNILLSDTTQIKVRDKDIDLLHPGPVSNFNEIVANSDDFSADAQTCAQTCAQICASVREAWELLQDEDNTNLSLKDLTSIIYGDYTPSSAYSVYCILQDGLYFTYVDSINSIILRSKEEAEAEEIKRNEKMREGKERDEFLERCRKKLLSNIKMSDNNTIDDIPHYMRFIQDVEALAYGKSAKSRTMKELKLGETPEDAHEFLLKTGIWSNMINPHPARFGVSLNSASAILCTDAAGEPPLEDRRDLCSLAAFAIDSPWSNDPDDAISVEINGTQRILYVHVADPAASIKPDSGTEKEARLRGSTLYLPEKTIRMMPDEAIPMFALGLSEKSLALTFKLTISENGEITDTEIFPSVVSVQRLTYDEADKLMEDNNSITGTALRDLDTLAQCLYKKRETQGAVNIELPDVHISIENGFINIMPVTINKSSFIVRECMIAAGTGAGTWASEKGIAMPYISQEAELPGSVLPGFAGSMQLRKSMRPRIISVKPGRHQGMGLEIYTQVTSPLRRYTDLLAHMQIRAYLKGEAPLSPDEVTMRFSYSEAAASACVQAERASENHWKMVFLSDKKDSEWNAVAVEKKMNRWLVLIPALALETQVTLNKDVKPNDEIKVILKSVNIPRGEAVFVTETLF